jgi:hypothetical protein
VGYFATFSLIKMEYFSETGENVKIKLGKNYQGCFEVVLRKLFKGEL